MLKFSLYRFLGLAGERGGPEEEADVFPSIEELPLPEVDVGSDVCEECPVVKNAVQFSGVVYVPRAAPTLQLAVGDAVKTPSIQSLIRKARTLSAKLRTHHCVLALTRRRRRPLQ